MKKQMKEKGITLIALVVTIIILLILTGVTLNMALSDNGLFKKAKEAVEKYERAQEDEEEAIRQITTQMYSEYVGATVTGYEPTQGTCKITAEQSGYTAEQEFTTDVAKTAETPETGMQWRIWDFDGNILRIIGDPTSQKLVLKGVAGYNNGVWAIDKICKDCYSNGKEGVTVTSLRRTDIQKVSSYDYTHYKHEKDKYDEVTDNSKLDEELIHFGESKSDYISENKKYPQMWNENDRGWTYEYDKETKKATGGDRECTTWENVGKGEGKIDEKEMTLGSGNTTFKESYYYHNYKESEFSNKKYYNLIFKKSDGANAQYYWLAGRCVNLFESYCRFSMQNVSADNWDSTVCGYPLCFSTGGPEKGELTVRPMVSIDLTKSKCSMTTEIGEDGNIKNCNLSFAD